MKLIKKGKFLSCLQNQCDIFIILTEQKCNFNYISIMLHTENIPCQHLRLHPRKLLR